MGGSLGSSVIAKITHVAEIRWARHWGWNVQKASFCGLSLHVASQHPTVKPELLYSMAAGF